MKRIALTGAVLIGSLLSFNLIAAQLSPEQQAANAAATRQAVFKLLSFSNGPLAGMARGAPYDATAAKNALMRIQTLAPMIPEVFAAMDTTAYKDLKTRANDIIWTSQADFAMLAGDLGKAAADAMAVLNSKGADGVKEAVGMVGPKCGACHDRFRHD